jgi:IS5 family transposase
MGIKQLGFGDYEQATAKKRTKRERFLSEMEKVVPWKALLDLIEPHYPKTSSKGGRPPYPLRTRSGVGMPLRRTARLMAQR